LFEEPCSKLQGIFDRKEVCHFQIRSLTPQQAAGNALAFAVQIPQVEIERPSDSKKAVCSFSFHSHILEWLSREEPPWGSHAAGFGEETWKAIGVCLFADKISQDSFTARRGHMGGRT
jgi:hypothetical protein